MGPIIKRWGLDPAWGVGRLPQGSDIGVETSQVSRCSAGGDVGEEHPPGQRELDVQRPWDGSARPSGGWKEDQSGAAE